MWVHRNTPNVSRLLFTSNSIATSAASVEVCVLPNVVLRFSNECAAFLQARATTGRSIRRPKTCSTTAVFCVVASASSAPSRITHFIVTSSIIIISLIFRISYSSCTLSTSRIKQQRPLTCCSISRSVYSILMTNISGSKKTTT